MEVYTNICMNYIVTRRANIWRKCYIVAIDSRHQMETELDRNMRHVILYKKISLRIEFHVEAWVSWCDGVSVCAIAQLTSNVFVYPFHLYHNKHIRKHSHTHRHTQRNCENTYMYLLSSANSSLHSCALRCTSMYSTLLMCPTNI